MYRKQILSFALLAALVGTTGSCMAAEPNAGESADRSAIKPAVQGAMTPAVQDATTPADQGATTPADLKAYFLHIEGRALPLRQALVNGVNVLGGSVISLSLPINISGYTKAGLNQLVLDYKSDPKSNLTILVEKRTPGPKTEEIAKLVVPPDDSKGAVKTKAISFNLPTDGGVASVGTLTDQDKASIKEQFERYYKALASAKADQIKSMFRQCISDERKLCPESAKFYDNVLTREVEIIKNKDLKLNPLNSDGLVFKVEGDIVKVCHQDKSPLVESNEVQVEIAPLMFEVGQPKAKSGAKTGKKSNTMTVAHRPNKTKDIEVQAADFKPDGDKSAGKNLDEKSVDGTVAAHEIKVEDSPAVFDGSLPAQPATSQLPVQTSAKERLIRRNLYFKPSKPDSSGKRAWSISLPPNV